VVEITRLPPGEALGARDLQRWSSRRATGRAGVRQTTSERKKLEKFTRSPMPDAADRWLATHDKPPANGSVIFDAKRYGIDITDSERDAGFGWCLIPRGSVFWDDWNAHKAEFKADGYRIEKRGQYGEQWGVSRASSLDRFLMRQLSAPNTNSP